MKHLYLKIIAFIVLINPLVNSKVTAQQSEFRLPEFKRITTADGLSNNSAFSLTQDRRGFIWIATNYGLNRYDGYEFKNFNYNPKDSISALVSYSFELVEDKNGIFWQISNGYLISFNPVTEKFNRYGPQPGKANSLSGDILESNLTVDKNGILWMCTSHGLNSFDPVANKFRTYLHNINDSTTISSNYLYATCMDDDNNLWVVTSANTIDVFNITSKKVIDRFAIGSVQLPGNKSMPFLNAIKNGRDGNLWICSEFNGLYRYNVKTKNWKHFYYERGNNYSLKYNGITTCYEDTEGNLIIGLSQGGISFYESASGKFYYLNVSDVQPKTIIKDRCGKIWMATGDDGVFVADPVKKNIISKNYFSGNDQRPDLVIGFYRSTQGKLMLGCRNGVFIFDKASGNLNRKKIIENGKDLFDENMIWTIRQDSKDVYWFCTVNGLISYDEKTNVHHYYQFTPNDTTSLSSHSTTCIAEDNMGRLWVTTYGGGGGLNLFLPQSGTFKQFKIHIGDNSIGSNYASWIFKDLKGMLYIGGDGGLVRLNPANVSFRVFRHHAADPFSISCDAAWPLYEAKNGILWIGTVGGGLVAFDPSSEKFKSFTMKDGLPSDAVLALANDHDGNTWLGTYHGISRCRLPDNPFEKNCKIDFRNYDMSDGLPSNDVWFGGAHCEPDGTIYFAAGRSGFYYFNPHDLKDNEYIPPVYITGLSLMNKVVSSKDSGSFLQLPIDFTKKIVLPYRKNILSFTFAALNFIHPEKNKYAYMLENYDEDWIETDAKKRFATYTNLDPGEYIFKVKGSNNDGAWNDKPTELKIIITPPFWQTAWFRILVAAVVIALLYAFYRYRIGQILLLQRIRNKIAADLHDDIGSTLNSISIFSEVARKDQSKRDHAMKMIGESSRKVVESMSDIVCSINPVNDSFDKIIFRMRSLSYNLLKAKKIECSFHADENLSEIKLPMDIRRNFYLIFKEALNNLIKYSQASKASILISREHGSITCVVRDDGVGFDITQDYAGNGLGNMKKRAEEIGALLSIDSEKGRGTSIELNLKT